MILLDSMSTLPSEEKRTELTTFDTFAMNTLMIMVTGFCLLITGDFIRESEITRDVLMINMFGTMFVSVPLMLIVASRNIMLWNEDERFGLGAFLALLVAMVGLPALAMIFKETGADSSMSAYAFKRFVYFTHLSAILIAIATATFAFYCIRDMMRQKKATEQPA